MKIIQRVLIVLLALLAVAHIATSIYESVSGRQDAPTISCPSDILEVSTKDPESVLLQDVTASDKQDGDLTGQVILGGKSKLIGKDTATITYLVFDSDDNMGICTRRIRYVDYHRPQFSINEPLIYAPDEDIILLSRLNASDVVDGDLTDQIRVSTLAATSNSEIYLITVQVTNSIGDTAMVKLPVLLRESNPPAPDIQLTSYLIYLDQGSDFDASSFVSSVTVNGVSVPTSDVVIKSDVDTSAAGTYQVTYTYPTSGHMGTTILTVVVQ
jgi:hypothetical protein